MNDNQGKNSKNKSNPESHPKQQGEETKEDFSNVKPGAKRGTTSEARPHNPNKPKR
jgi:hypothetical protein